MIASHTAMDPPTYHHQSTRSQHQRKIKSLTMTLAAGRLMIPLLVMMVPCGLNFWTSKSILFSLHGADLECEDRMELLKKLRRDEFEPEPQPSSYPSAADRADPEALDCKELLKKFRQDEIEVAKTTQVKQDNITKEKNFKRTFGVITKTAKPFYISTHDGEIDSVRASIMKQRKYYESALTERVAEVFEEKVQKNESSLFLDVGTNIGWFSLVAVAHGASKVYSFEPNLQNTIRFCESLSMNRWLRDDLSKDVVVPISKGVGNREESRNLYGRSGGKNPGEFSFKGGNSDKVVGTMEITTMDLFADRHGWFKSKPSIGLMKVDVEHFELEVMEGAARLLQSNLVEKIAMELKHDHPLESKRKILQFLYGAGYELYMHGTWMGPHKKVDKSYNSSSFEELLQDFHEKKIYGENVMFSLSGL